MAAAPTITGFTGSKYSTMSLQKALAEAGYDPGDLDGLWGSRTEGALRLFQQAKGLQVDGIPGPETWGALAPEDTSQAGWLRPDGSHHMLISQGVEHPTDGLNYLNWRNDNVHHFRNRSVVNRAGRRVDEIVVHESTSRSRASTVRAWQAGREGSKGRYYIGIHLSIDPDGSVHQHNDLHDHQLIHGGPHNAHSVGIEIINPYYPAWNTGTDNWPLVIQAPWADALKGSPRCYVLPTLAQMEALANLIDLMTSPGTQPAGLTIPQHWVGLEAGKLAFTRVVGAKEQRGGIYSHGYFGHADGWWPVLYSWLRLELQLPPRQCYETAIKLATDARGHVDLTPYLGGD